MPVPCVEVHHATTAGADLAQCERLLSNDERARRDCLLRTRDRTEFTVAHALLRMALSRRRPEVRPEAWTFRTGDRGKPELRDGPTSLRFNLTHADGLVACVVTEEVDVGIDAEPLDRPGPRPEQLLAPDELAAVRAAEDPGAAFFVRWTLKEAYAKACGLGMAVPFRRLAFSASVSVSVSVDPPIVLATDLDDPAGWSFHQLRPTARHVLSVAARAARVDFVVL